MLTSSPRAPRGILVFAGLLSIALLVLGSAWALSRSQANETPRWDEDAFIALREAPGAPQAWSENWVVAVHPGCPHCRVSLASLAAARDHGAARVRVTALLVDAAEPPADSLIARLPADATHWDSEGVWRRRWGHRIYGEVFCFDPEGRMRRVLAPLADEDDAMRRLSARGLDGFTQ